MFKGNDYRHDHFVTPRRCENYYPHKGDRMVGRAALMIGYCFTVIVLFSWWVG